MAEAYNLTCTAGSDINLDLDPEESVVSSTPLNIDTASIEWLHGWGEDSQQKLQEMESVGWLDERTRRIQVSFLVYNANSDMLSMTHVNFLFARSGRIWKELTHWTMVLHPYKTWKDYTWDFLFYVHVTFLMVCEIREVLRAIWSDKMHPLRALGHYAN